MNIFGRSKIRKELMGLYFSHPEKRYYIRQLARITGSPAAYARKALLKLQEEGLLKSEFQGKERYFYLNKEYPLYEEIKKIVSKTMGAEGLLRKTLQKITGIESAFIFGSFAQGKEDAQSDIDLMVLGHPEEDEIVLAVSKLEKALDREINYHIYSRTEFGKKVQGKESFVHSIMRHPKIFIIGHEKELSTPHR